MTTITECLREEKTWEVYLYNFTHNELKEAKEKHIEKLSLHNRALDMVWIQ